MASVKEIFGIKEKREAMFVNPARQSVEQTEDYAVKKVIHLQEGTIEKTPVNNNDIANKAYADSVGGGAPEGTAVKSTGEVGGTKFLREDGDGTSSWQTVTAPAPEGTAVLSTGEVGGTKFLREDGDGTSSWQSVSGFIVDSTDTVKDTHIDWGTGAAQVSADDIPDGSTNAIITLTQETNFETAYTHSQDNTQAHSDYLLNSEADVGVGLTLTGDNSSADTAYVPMVLYNTDATPPTASNFPIGTIYIQYTP